LRLEVLVVRFTEVDLVVFLTSSFFIKSSFFRSTPEALFALLPLLIFLDAGLLMGILAGTLLTGGGGGGGRGCEALFSYRLMFLAELIFWMCSLVKSGFFSWL
jgi:hypothetical protein